MHVQSYKVLINYKSSAIFLAIKEINHKKSHKSDQEIDH